MKTSISIICTLLLSVSLILAGGSCKSSKKTSKKKTTSQTTTKPASPPTATTPAKPATKPTEPTKPATKPTEPTKPAEQQGLEMEQGSGIKFMKSSQLMPVLEEANKRNMPVFVEFWASWCGPCKTLEREVFNSAEVADFVNKNFLSVKFNIDTQDGKGVAQLYNADRLPTMLFLDKKGVELGRIVGTTTPGRFIQSGADALGKQ